MNRLLEKYNIPVPRYTSYPTVPEWKDTPSAEQWKDSVKNAFKISNHREGISLYIHLPYCESLCTYCACNTRITVNHAVEGPYIKSLLREWDLYLALFNEKPRIREIHLGGGTPTFFSTGHLDLLLTGILNTSDLCTDAELSFEAHPDNTTQEHLETLHRMGFRRVSFGIQDFDSKVQEAIHRFQTVKQVKDVVDMARTIGYTSVNFDLVYGLPFQTNESMANTLQEVIALKPERIAFYSYAHVPWIKPGQRKFTEQDLPVGETKRKLYEMGLSVFKSNGYHHVGMDHFALPGDALFTAMETRSLHRNFMGYTPHKTQLLIALGASSISDTGNCFIQNHKTVEFYQEAIALGDFPIFKGHLLNEQDLFVREQILNIMCHLETSWPESFNQLSWWSEGLQRLTEFETDGLIQLSNNRLKVTKTGHNFLRNICFCLDVRHWQSVDNKVRFSSAV